MAFLAAMYSVAKYKAIDGKPNTLSFHELFYLNLVLRTVIHVTR